MSPEIRKAAWMLLRVWEQYGHKLEQDGEIYLEHSNMCAGERATEWLEELGLAVDDGHCARLTQAGRELIDSEEFE